MVAKREAGEQWKTRKRYLSSHYLFVRAETVSLLPQV